MRINATHPWATTPLREDILRRMRKMMRIPPKVTAQRRGGNPCGVGIGLSTGSIRIFGSKSEETSVEGNLSRITDLWEKKHHLKDTRIRMGESPIALGAAFKKA